MRPFMAVIHKYSGRTGILPGFVNAEDRKGPIAGVLLSQPNGASRSVRAPFVAIVEAPDFWDRHDVAITVWHTRCRVTPCLARSDFPEARL